MDYNQAQYWFSGLSHPLNTDDLYTQTYLPLPSLNTLEIKYPGRKNGGLDYRLSLNNFSVRHTDLVRIIYNLSNSGFQREALDFLVDINRNGLHANHNLPLPRVNIENLQLNPEQLKTLIFWVTLQENFNYPAPKLGIRMPFYRYIEAIIAQVQPDLLSLDNVLYRTDYRGTPPFQKFTHPDLHIDFVFALNQIGN